MNSNNLQSQLRRYFRQINRRLPCARRERMRLLSSLRCDITIYLKEYPKCGLEDIVEHFGTVEDIADAYISSENTERYMKRQERLFAVTITAWIVCVMTGGVIFIYNLYKAKHSVVNVFGEN